MRRIPFAWDWSYLRVAEGFNDDAKAHKWLEKLWTQLAVVNALLMTSSMQPFVEPENLERPTFFIWALCLTVNSLSLVSSLLLYGYLAAVMPATAAEPNVVLRLNPEEPVVRTLQEVLLRLGGPGRKYFVTCLEEIDKLIPADRTEQHGERDVSLLTLTQVAQDGIRKSLSSCVDRIDIVDHTEGLQESVKELTVKLQTIKEVDQPHERPQVPDEDKPVRQGTTLTVGSATATTSSPTSSEMCTLPQGCLTNNQHPAASNPEHTPTQPSMEPTTPIAARSAIYAAALDVLGKLQQELHYRASEAGLVNPASNPPQPLKTAHARACLRKLYEAQLLYLMEFDNRKTDQSTLQCLWASAAVASIAIAVFMQQAPRYTLHFLSTLGRTTLLPLLGTIIGAVLFATAILVQLAEEAHAAYGSHYVFWVSLSLTIICVVVTLFIIVLPILTRVQPRLPQCLAKLLVWHHGQRYLEEKDKSSKSTGSSSSGR